jgi:hypothetical protein
MTILAKPLKKLFGGKSAKQAIEENDQDKEKPDPLIPDYDALRMAARRRAAMRTGGRRSTILSDRLGP